MFAQTFILPGVVSFLSEERLHNGSEMPGAVSARAERRSAGKVFPQFSKPRKERIMFNTYSIHGNEIWIDAPENSNTNRLRNDLIWAINGICQLDLICTSSMCKGNCRRARCISAFHPFQ